MRLFNSVCFVFLVSITGALSFSSVSAQSDRGGSPLLKMNAEDFDHWVDTISIRMEADRESPTQLTLAIVQRLKDGIFTTDHAIFTSLKAWITYDQRLREYIGESSGTPMYAQSMAYLDGLLLYMYGRPHLEARLWERKAFLHQLEENYAGEQEATRNAIDLLDPAQVNNDQIRMDLKARMGMILMKQERTGEAENFFLEVLNYDWRQISKAPEARNLLRASYVQAGLGLIECRRGNLTGLKSIEFIPEVSDRLDPVLKAAIEDAK